MTSITRREFLRTVAVGLGALAAREALSGCGPGEPVVSTEALPKATEVSSTATEVRPTATQVPTPVPPTPTPLPPDLAVTRGGEPRELVRKAVEAVGGIGRFVPRGANVIIKSNICVSYWGYEYAATTNPWVVAALVELCWEAGAGRVRVMDHPFGGTAEEAYVRSGMADRVRAAGGQMEVMSRFKFVLTDIPNGLDLRQCEVYDEIPNADVVINVPIAKHHSLARLTLGMKNLMGVILNRPMMHANLGQRLADLASLIRPALTVVDAVRILVAHGPTGGNLGDVRELNTVLASPDLVAADSYTATLFGLAPDDLGYIRSGVAMGLGRSDLGAMKIEEIVVGG